MISLKYFGAGAAIISLLLAVACSKTSDSQNVEVAEEAANEPTPSMEPGEMALISYAHRKMGEQHTYYDEFISYDGGFAKVCGLFERLDEKGIRRPFYFSLDKQAILNSKNDPQWNMFCAGKSYAR